MQSLNDTFRYDTVIFDVGGTLLGFHEQAPFQEFLNHVELPATKEDAHQFHRRLISIIVADRDSAQGLGAHGNELYEWWRGIFTKTWPDRPSLAEEMLRWLFDGRFDRLFPDVLPALEALQELHMPMGVLSNFGLHLPEVLERFDLLHFFEFVIVSAEVKLAKPDPRVFDLVVKKADRPRERLLYVGDHVGDDVAGARGAGLDAVLIDRGDHQAGALCSRIHSLLDLADYVRLPTHPARAIIFDMDGIVLDSMPTHLLTWQQTLAMLGIDLTADDLYPLEGVPTERTAQRLTEKLRGQPCSDEEAQRLADHKRALFRKVFNPTLVPGIGPLVHDLHGRGYRLGLVTGSARSVVDESLTPTGVADLFDVIVTGDQVTCGKPDPEPYRTAAEGLGLFPGECLAIENAPMGIQSARAAGMACLALETTLPSERLSAAGADRVFHDAKALRAWLLAR
ncbi:MAG: HAD-IA family hydrolase [Anaerolineae bacterium]|jgi:HAD superfamily hydrolase (TIGR01509 family)